MVAIAAKDAEAAAAAAKDANAKAKALRENATPQQHPKIAKRQDLRGDITCRDGKQFILCKGCKKETSYAGWSQHCITHHSKVNGKANADAGDTDDDGSRSKTQPKAKASAKKTGPLKKGPPAKKKTSPRGS